MNIRTWKLVRSFTFAALVSGVAVFAMLRGAEPTTTGTTAIIAVLLFGGFELHELAAARGVLLGSTRHDHTADPPDAEPSEEDTSRPDDQRDTDR